MHGRNLTGSTANVFDLDVFVRDNQHRYEAFLYGFQQQLSISGEVIKAFSATIEMKALFWIRSHDIKNVLEMKELLVGLVKYLRVEIPTTFEADITYSLVMQMRSEIINTLEARITVSVKRVMYATEGVNMAFVVGTIDRGRLIADIENLSLADIEGMTIEQLTAGITGTQHGLRLGLVKPMVIANIQDLTLAQLQDRTIESICFTRVE